MSSIENMKKKLAVVAAVAVVAVHADTSTEKFIKAMEGKNVKSIDKAKLTNTPNTDLKVGAEHEWECKDAAKQIFPTSGESKMKMPKDTAWPGMFDAGDEKEPKAEELKKVEGCLAKAVLETNLKDALKADKVHSDHSALLKDKLKVGGDKEYVAGKKKTFKQNCKSGAVKQAEFEAVIESIDITDGKLKLKDIKRTKDCAAATTDTKAAPQSAASALKLSVWATAIGAAVVGYLLA